MEEKLPWVACRLTMPTVADDRHLLTSQARHGLCGLWASSLVNEARIRANARDQRWLLTLTGNLTRQAKLQAQAQARTDFLKRVCCCRERWTALPGRPRRFTAVVLAAHLGASAPSLRLAMRKLGICPSEAIESREEIVRRQFSWAITECQGVGEPLSTNRLFRRAGLNRHTHRGFQPLAIKLMQEAQGDLATSSCAKYPL